MVRRILAKHYRPESDGDGVSWLTAIRYAKDSLWSIDLFRCESIVLQRYWVMVIIEVFRDGSSGSVSGAVILMESRFVGCSTM